MTEIAARASQYNGKVTPVGNSKGIRLDAAFLKAHPEFNGAVRATVLTDGQVLLSVRADPDVGLANASVYLDVFGCVVAAWLWLKQALAARQALLREANSVDRDYYNGKVHTARHYIEWELPLVDARLALLTCVNRVPITMKRSWY